MPRQTSQGSFVTRVLPSRNKLPPRSALAAWRLCETPPPGLSSLIPPSRFGRASLTRRLRIGQSVLQMIAMNAQADLSFPRGEVFSGESVVIRAIRGFLLPLLAVEPPFHVFSLSVYIPWTLSVAASPIGCSRLDVGCRTFCVLSPPAFSLLPASGLAKLLLLPAFEICSRPRQCSRIF
jgi:hypothetical protein